MPAAAVDLGEAGSVAAAAVAEEAAGLAVAVAAVKAACAPMGGETTRARSAQ